MDIQRTRVFVGSLSKETDERNLRAAFGAVGTVRSVLIARNQKTGMSRRFGFVEMAQEEQALAAMSEISGIELDGCVLTVAEAHPPSRPFRQPHGRRGR
jgi:RNA recognition motif-containing protein